MKRENNLWNKVITYENEKLVACLTYCGGPELLYGC